MSSLAASFCSTESPRTWASNLFGWSTAVGWFTENPMGVKTCQRWNFIHILFAFVSRMRLLHQNHESWIISPFWVPATLLCFLHIKTPGLTTRLPKIISSLNQPPNQPSNQLTSQPTNHPTNLATTQPTNQPISQLANYITNQPINQLIFNQLTAAANCRLFLFDSRPSFKSNAWNWRPVASRRCHESQWIGVEGPASGVDHTRKTKEARQRHDFGWIW